jgi:DeoR family transcriptional regulator, fructose operon transcriptional repressor
LSGEASTGSRLPARRRAELLDRVTGQLQASVSDLAAEFGVSVDTIRRDLVYLEGKGLLTRTHGGAVPVGMLAAATVPFSRRMTMEGAAKERIGTAAASFVSDKETLLVNGGTTALSLVQALGARQELTVVTNNLRVPAELPPGVARDVYLLGGTCLLPLMCTVGPVGFAGTGPISADIAFIGVGGVSVNGPSTSRLAEAQMMREMIEASRMIIVLADGSKLGLTLFAQICDWDLVSVLVTDAEPSSEIRSALDEADVDVVIS